MSYQRIELSPPRFVNRLPGAYSWRATYTENLLLALTYDALAKKRRLTYYGR
ncbi:hypothetical protein LINPERHAP1_LOCUS11321 [Linum perenne]